MNNAKIIKLKIRLYTTDDVRLLNNLNQLSVVLEVIENCYNLNYYKEFLIMNRKKNIDKYFQKVVLKILNLSMYLNTFIDWYNNKWISFINDNEIKYKKDFESATNNLILYNYWILNYIYYPKRYEYSVHLRTFFEVLETYLKYSINKNKVSDEMWESSQYLKYYVHLIFKTGKYKRKIFNDSEITEELKKIKSYLSYPLHGYLIYYNKLFIPKNNLNKKINKIVELISKFGIDKDVIRIPINPKVRGSKQDYLKCTMQLYFDNWEVEKFLNFIKRNCEHEFNKEIENHKK